LQQKNVIAIDFVAIDWNSCSDGNYATLIPYGRKLGTHHLM
jgi:hypothetical protein